MSSIIRNREERETVPARTLTSLENQKKLLLAKKVQDLITAKHKRLADVIEEEDILESHSP